MRPVLLALLMGLLAACSNSAPLPSATTSLDPDDAAAPVAGRPYRPVMAGTVYHGIGDRP